MKRHHREVLAILGAFAVVLVQYPIVFRLNAVSGPLRRRSHRRIDRHSVAGMGRDGGVIIRVTGRLDRHPEVRPDTLLNPSIGRNGDAVTARVVGRGTVGAVFGV